MATARAAVSPFRVVAWSCPSWMTQPVTGRFSHGTAENWRPRSVLLVGELGQAVARLPELGIDALLDQAAEQLDRRSLRADHLISDHAGDDQVVAHSPQSDALVPRNQELGQLVEIFVLSTLDVERDDVQACLSQLLGEGLPERRGHPADLAEAGRVEAAPVSEHLADRLVLPGRERLQHLEMADHVVEREHGAAQQPLGAGEISLLDEARRL